MNDIGNGFVMDDYVYQYHLKWAGLWYAPLVLDSLHIKNCLLQAGAYFYGKKTKLINQIQDRI